MRVVHLLDEARSVCRCGLSDRRTPAQERINAPEVGLRSRGTHSEEMGNKNVIEDARMWPTQTQQGVLLKSGGCSTRGRRSD
ncbi:hypothetical protein OJAV_G00233980 [Oryzias javanicus]|uniref:Uncharacterized protein n=1 Tax=Oryzias javanicus TaxID=123683 RepID=A0A437BYV8_ORYJA|nr:hypothetical protein OJAV_G00233980 [Oryzias javanicus]